MVSNSKVVPNRKGRRHPKHSRSVGVQDRISDDERQFRNHKNKIAKASRKKNR